MNSSYSFIVVGAGIAGLRAAIELNQHGTVLCLAKRELSESNTQYAQGGIAVALGPDDSPEIHLRDTVAAGAGLVDENAARTLVSEGPIRVQELLRWGARFDRDAAGQLAFTREGAHSRNRVCMPTAIRLEGRLAGHCLSTPANWTTFTSANLDMRACCCRMDVWWEWRFCMRTGAAKR